MKSITLLKTIAAPLFAVCTLPALAQANTLEVAAGGGLASYRAQGTTSNKGQFDASVDYNVASHFGIGFEYVYSPIAAINDSYLGYSMKGTAHIDHFGGVSRIAFSAGRVQPYVVVAAGALRETATEAVSGNGYSASASSSSSGAYGGVGGGASLFVGGNWGVRPEVRYERLHIGSGSNLNEIDVTGSVFYRFGGGRHT